MKSWFIASFIIFFLQVGARYICNESFSLYQSFVCIALFAIYLKMDD